MSTYLMIQWVKEPSGKVSGFMSGTLNLHFLREPCSASLTSMLWCWSMLDEYWTWWRSSNMPPWRSCNIEEERNYRKPCGVLLCESSNTTLAASKASRLQIWRCKRSNQIYLWTDVSFWGSKKVLQITRQLRRFLNTSGTLLGRQSAREFLGKCQ